MGVSKSMKEDILKLTEALENRGFGKTIIEETVCNIEQHTVDLIYWDDTDKERILLHAFLLARAKSFLQDSLAQSSIIDGQGIIEKYIRKIDEHFIGHQWPTDISEDDPVLLKQLWRQQNTEINLIRQSPDQATQALRISSFKNESYRLLRTLLKLPVIASIQGHYEPVLTRDLVTAAQTQSDPSIKAVIEEELQTRYPDAYNFLTAFYGHRNIAKLDRLLDLKKISSQGFLKSMLQNREAFIALIDNLTIAQNTLGKQNFFKITESWDTLNKLRFVAVLAINQSSVCFGRYYFDYPLEYSDSMMPLWMQDNTEGQLKIQASSHAGTYLLLFDNSFNNTFNKKSRKELNEQYISIQDNLIKPNYDALNLIVTHANKITKMTAQKILSLLGSMVAAYQKIASPAKSDLAFKQYNLIGKELNTCWQELSERDELPDQLRSKIISLEESPLSQIKSVHSLIRFLHEAGNQALEKKMILAQADITVTIGSIGSDEIKEIQLAKLDDAPVIINGLIHHPAIAAIVQASRRMPSSMPGVFVVINNHITYSVKLGEHRAEFSANIEHPDHEGFVRLQSYQGGIEIEQQLRAAFVESVLKEKGMMVKCEQEGLIDSLVTGILDKDRGARTRQQIEDTVILVLRLIGSLRDLDYAMAYIFSQEILSSNRSEKIDTNKINKFAMSFANMFLVEGMIPFSYTGEGMPFATYCEYRGSKVLNDFKAYHSSEQRMFRYRLYFAINALLQSVELPVIQPGKGGVGQEVINEYFNKPLKNGLNRRELRFNTQGFIEKNPAYQPIREIISKVITHENEALRIAFLMKKTNLKLDFTVIGSIDQLMLMRAQHETVPDEWLVIYGLADEENNVVLYAFSRYLTVSSDGEWLSVNSLRKILRKSGYETPGKLHIPGFQKVVSHRLLIGQPHELNKMIGASVRGLSASVGDGSVRIGRITFDRNYCFNSQAQDRQILLVPFTTPEDIEAIRSAEAVLVTSGGLLSHAGVTTRELAIPSLILPHAEWLQSSDGMRVRLEERYPAQMNITLEGFWVSHSIVSEVVEVHEGDMVLVWASQGLISIISMDDAHLEHVHRLIQSLLCGENSAVQLEHYLANVLLSMVGQENQEQIASNIIGLILAEALWDRRVNSTLRRQLVDILQHACSGMSVNDKLVKLPEKSAAYINTLAEQLTNNALMELEGLLSEIEHNISKVNVLWRALNVIAVAERHWVQVKNLANSLIFSNQRLQMLEKRIVQLRYHPRITLLRASLLHEVESLSSTNLKENDLPLIRQTLRCLGYRRSRHSGQSLKVLMVCTANVDRSPMAEFLLKKMLSDKNITGIEVFSRGVAATDDNLMSETGQAVLLLEDGICAKNHRSKKITEKDVENADIILAMECFHVDFLKEKYFDAADKIFLLSDYANRRVIGDIKDPAGQLTDAYHRLRQELQASLTGVIKRMREEGLLVKAMVDNLQTKADGLARVKRQQLAESGRIVAPLDAVDADFVELVGGKGANLGEIAQLVKQYGATVPPALMVTTQAFQRFLEENDLLDAYMKNIAAIDVVLAAKEIPDPDQYAKIVSLLEKIRSLILQGRLESDAGTGRKIIQAIHNHGLKDTYFSVRSSGLEEDTEEASFAGVAETYLYVSPDELLECIKKVWMSFWLMRGILYRSERIIQKIPIKPAVVLQEMFDSQVSGVIFTTDPVSDRDVIVIEAGYGLGEGVVSGLVDVDRYYVNKFDGSVINMHIGKKAFKVMRHPSGKGTCIESVDNALREVPCLNEQDINIPLIMALEEHYALSQDIEFGISNGKISILQTRPITTRS